MFEEIERLPLAVRGLITGMQPVSAAKIADSQAQFIGCPKEYWCFQNEIGFGKIKAPDEPVNFPAHFEYSECLVSAEKEYYQDSRIYDGGARGDILLFGFESTGIAFGFDTGDEFKLVEVDNFRIVRKLNLGFKDFAIGMLICYPDFPDQFKSGKWYNDLGDEFAFPNSNS